MTTEQETAQEFSFWRWRAFLIAFCVTSMIAGAIMGEKTVQVMGVSLPGSTLVFPLCYVCLAVVTEVYGLEQAMKLAVLCMSMFAFTIAGFDLVAALPYPASGRGAALEFTRLFAAGPRLFVAALVGFAVGASTGIAILAVANLITYRRLTILRFYGAPAASQIAGALAAYPILLAGKMTWFQILVLVLNKATFTLTYSLFLAALILIAVTWIESRENHVALGAFPTDRRRIPRKEQRST